ncbi:UNVERIFIED_CONTAM: hypothetical protein FKN15_041244 [Acipenser sinensis]
MHNASPIPLMHNASPIPLMHNASAIPLMHNASAIPLMHNASPIPLMHNASPIPLMHNASPIPLMHNASPIPLMHNASPIPLMHNASPIPLMHNASPIPLMHNASPIPLMHNASPIPLMHNASPIPLMHNASPIPLMHNASPIPLMHNASPIPLMHNASPIPLMHNASPIPLMHNASPIPLMHNASPIPLMHNASPIPLMHNASPIPLMHNASPIPLMHNASPIPLMHNASPIPLMHNASPIPLMHNASQWRPAAQKRVKIQARGQWASKTEFILTAAGQIVGLGNVWRFPYLCYKNGGGIGYASQVIIGYSAASYIIIQAWALFYLFHSFSWELPWASCRNTWNTGTCVEFDKHNVTSNGTIPENATSPATEFWERRVLSISGGIEEVGSLHWELMLCLLLCWIICYFCDWKGVKSTGKVVYFTAMFPYLMLAVLLIRGLTLPGAVDGIIFYLYPDPARLAYPQVVYFTATFPYLMLAVLLIRGLTLPGAVDGIIFYLYPAPARLADPQVWMDAGIQIFFSYSICGGNLITLGSYNRYNNNCYKDCMYLCLLNSGTSFVAGFAIFSVLGFMAHEQGVPISEVAESGPGLAFIAYPRAMAMMPLPQLWAFCFFLMVFLLGVDTEGTFIFSLAKYTPLKYNRTYEYPAWGYILGWFLALSSISFVPLWIVFKLTRTKGTMPERFRLLCLPASDLPLGKKQKESSCPFNSEPSQQCGETETACKKEYETEDAPV